MKTNVKRVSTHTTHEGAPASRITPLAELRRSLLACMLFEDTFYENGEDIATRIHALSKQCKPEDVAALAVEARNEQHLRHAPLWLALSLCDRKAGRLLGDTLYEIVQRPDEITEFLAMYWKGGRKPLAKQVKVGLARAFGKFDAYQLAKYDRPGAVRLRDALFMVHAKPSTPERADLYKALVEGTLATPDTWETNLSAGGDKRETFTRLLSEKKLGYMALLRNLRNMVESGVDEALVKGAILEGAGKSKALPFRFLAAARHAPRFESELDAAMEVAMREMPRLPGHTNLLVDVSGSMVGTKVSARSEIDRLDAAAALAVLARGVCESVRVFTFSNDVREVPGRTGMALVDAIRKFPHMGTYLRNAVAEVDDGNRLVVFTDEQAFSRPANPKGRGYMVNVASYRNGVGYGPWVHIDGFSEQCIRFIQLYEQS